MRISAIFPISQIDAKRYFDIVWDIFEQNPKNRYFAQQIIHYPRMTQYRPDDQYPGGDEWMMNNPEKLVSAIKLFLETKSPLTAKTKRDLEVGLSSPDYGYYSTGVTAMLLLPDETFKKHFSKFDKKYMTTSAYLVGNHFKAKWAYKKDQYKFYERYGHK